MCAVSGVLSFCKMSYPLYLKKTFTITARLIFNQVSLWECQLVGQV